MGVLLVIIIVVFVVFGVVAAIIQQYQRLQKLREQDYQWYRERYPEAIKGSRVTCNSCGSDRITVRGLMQHTYLREHVCTQCGSALYYSRESR